ncbi:DUF1488 domain-containing protein [Citrobacter sp. JGM124]|uniref:DUF1488 domain-containing protein n=1 Tax=Citrobacter sp. JGM124 TaxID=2799789 RepID=UPI001BACF9A1|nr:DUF1488 domain-containing protein [Citrobacter sp. JGM124]
MNQAIQFPDSEVWDENKQAICFTALVAGFQVNCAVSGTWLVGEFGGSTPEQWLALFRQHRWDLEEHFEALIRNEEEDTQGWYWLS